ncbi:MAG: hypothetical protein DHS20C21_20260 [Gemmatimonadota bacterium]|nr:MAG: hypothetical protein DHS20C21_20260 [Gemmatimonadota bacterium]
MASPDEPTSPPPNTRSIQEEHDQLRALLHELTVADITGAVPLLRRLRELLVRHFENEEGADGFESVARRQPQFLPKLEEIFEEHRHFLKRVDSLVDSTCACARHRKEILQEIAAMAHDLHEHEMKENALLGDIMYTDLGGHH